MAVYPIANLLKNAGLIESTSEAVRLIKQGGVKVDGEKISNIKLVIMPGNNHAYQVGKRKFAYIILT